MLATSNREPLNSLGFGRYLVASRVTAERGHESEITVPLTEAKMTATRHLGKRFEVQLLVSYIESKEFSAYERTGSCLRDFNNRKEYLTGEYAWRCSRFTK